MGHPPSLLRREPRADRGGRGARGARPPPRHPRRRPGALRLLRRARARDRRLRRALRPLVARRAPRAAGPAHVHARAVDQPGGRRGRRRPPGHVAPGRRRAPAQLPLRAGRDARRRRPCTCRSRRSRSCAARASSGSSPRCAPSSSTALIRSLPKDMRKRLVPVPDDRREGARAPQAAPGAAARRARHRDRGAARRAHPARRLGPRPAPQPPADDVQRRGRERQGDRHRPGPRRRCASGRGRRSAPRSPAATKKLERTGQTTWTFGTIPKAVALPGTGPDGARLPVAGRRGRDRRPARAGERGRPRR